MSLLLPKEGKPNRLSREAPLPLAPGGGAKVVLVAGVSGDILCVAAGGGALAAEILAAWVSNDMLTGRGPRGGEYGGGGGGDAFSEQCEQSEHVKRGVVFRSLRCGSPKGCARSGATPGDPTHCWGLYGCIALKGVCADEKTPGEATDTADSGVLFWLL